MSIYILLSWRGSWGRRLLAAALPLAVFAVVIAPWAVRNTRVQQTLTFIDVMGGRNAMMGNYEYTPLERFVGYDFDWCPTNTPGTACSIESEPATRRLRKDNSTSSPFVTRSHFVWTHPWLTVKRDVVKFFNFWQLDRLLVGGRGRWTTSANYPAATLLLLATVICGSYAAGASRSDLRHLLFSAHRSPYPLVPAGQYPVSLCSPHADLCPFPIPSCRRFRCWLVYAAAAIVSSSPDRGASPNIGGFRLAAFLCIIVVLGWLRELVFVDPRLVKNMIG